MDHHSTQSLWLIKVGLLVKLVNGIVCPKIKFWQLLHTSCCFKPVAFLLTTLDSIDFYYMDENQVLTFCFTRKESHMFVMTLMWVNDYRIVRLTIPLTRFITMAPLKVIYKSIVFLPKYCYHKIYKMLKVWYYSKTTMQCIPERQIVFQRPAFSIWFNKSI